MEKITIDKIDWYLIDDFMDKYGIKSNKTVYNKVKDKTVLSKSIYGRIRFARG